MNFWFVFSRTARSPGEDIPLTRGDILLLFTSLERAEEYLQDIRIEMQAFARECGGFITYCNQTELSDIKKSVFRRYGSAIKRCIVDPNPRDSSEEFKYKSNFF